MDKHYDVIIIGAGAAGLIAALEIAETGRSVAVIDAKEQSGGRIRTFSLENNYPFELGAEFVHGKLPVTLELAKKAVLETLDVKGRIWQKKDGELNEQEDFIEDFSDLQKKFKQLKEDITVEEFLNNYLQGKQFENLRFTLQNYVEGYYAADIKKASTFALRDELTKADDEQYRFKNGYQNLVEYLETECKKNGVEFFFSEPVWQLHWQKNKVEAITEKGSYLAKKAIVTVPIGVLQTEGITFSPSLPHIKEAAKQLGFGHVVKVNLWFEKAFWEDKTINGNKNFDDLNFLFSEEIIPTWWTQHPAKEPILTGWLGGPKAEMLQTKSEEEIIQKAIRSLSGIFNLDVIHLSQLLKKAKFYNWSADSDFNGAYSYAVLNGEKLMQRILQPVEGTIYFAGEGLHHGNEIGTVEAALQSGRTVSRQLVAVFS